MVVRKRYYVKTADEQEEGKAIQLSMQNFDIWHRDAEVTDPETGEIRVIGMDWLMLKLDYVAPVPERKPARGSKKTLEVQP